MRKSRYILIQIVVIAVLAIAACTRPDHSAETKELQDELTELGTVNPELAVERADNAEQAGVFTVSSANNVKAVIYENAGQRRMAAYYAEKVIEAEAGHAITTSEDSSNFYTPRWILADVAYANGEYGKSIALAKEILTFAGDSTSTKVAALKCRALSQMAECESELGHVDEAERLLQQCIDIMMESSQHATKFGETDPLIYTLLTLNDLYIDNKIAERALPLMTKMDTAIIRLANCPDTPDRVIQIRRNYVTISKAMIYALTGQRKQAEVLLWRSRLPMFFTLDQSADEGGTMN